MTNSPNGFSADSAEHSLAVSNVVWRHKKRGTTYQVVTHFAALQCATDQAIEDRFDDLNWTIYRSREDGAVYMRLTSEFMDGRFERVGTKSGDVAQSSQVTALIAAVEEVCSWDWSAGDSCKEALQDMHRLQEAYAALASQPSPVATVGMDWKLSDDAKQAIAEIDRNIREAPANIASHSRLSAVSEPVAWQRRPTFGDYRVWSSVSASPEDHEFWREQEYEIRPLYTREPQQPSAGNATHDALSDAHRALVAFKDAVIASDHFKGREYVGLGIQVNNAIDKARIALASETGR
jgi:hypothetical protein